MSIQTLRQVQAVSTLSLLEPFRRVILGIPFLYQRISSSTPLTALISTMSPITSFTVVHLDGRIDWILAQRQALLAWTGHSLAIKPTVNTQMVSEFQKPVQTNNCADR